MFKKALNRSATEHLRRVLGAAETWVPYRDVIRNDPCVYCCVWPMEEREREKKTLEHITPRFSGGKDGWRNLAVAHATCNLHRGHAPLLRFFLYRQAEVGLRGRHNKGARAKAHSWWLYTRHVAVSNGQPVGRSGGSR